MTIEKENREIGMKQVKGIQNVFNSFFEKEKFNFFIEIGTGTGIFSLYLCKKANEMNAKFITFDILDIKEKIKNRLNELGGKFYLEDINKNDEIENLIKTNNRILILNDGGLKLPQIKRFAPILKQNDCILSHDYYAHKKETKFGTIIFSEVEPLIKNYNLKTCYENLFDGFLWLCCIKEEQN